MSKTKRVVSILLSLVMLLSVSTMFSITASAEDITLHNGDTITASVYIDGDSTKLICYQLELAFDDSKVSIETSDISVKISNGNNMVNVNNEFSRALVNTTSPTPLSSGVKKNDLLCTFTFHVKDDIPVASIGDYIEAKKMIYYDNALGEDIGPTQLRMEISYNKQSFDPEPPVKTYQKGDINCDGSINIVDMQILAKYVDLIKTNPESKLITKYAPMVTCQVAVVES